MDISEYAAYFHDGLILDIVHTKDKIDFSMASAEIDEGETQGNIILSRDFSIQGKLHIEGIQSIKLNENEFSGTLKKLYDRGKIFDFEITKNSIEISIIWTDFLGNSEVKEFSIIKIKAENIWWENIPDLESL